MTMALEIQEASRIIRRAIRDKSYRSAPLGLEVARYIRWKRSEWGATTETIRDYEAILAKLALFYADLGTEPWEQDSDGLPPPCLRDLNPPVGVERLRECWDHYWGERSARTRAKVRSVWVDFFDWAGRERGMHGNPARALASPRRRDVKRDPFGHDFVARVLGAPRYLADTLGCRLILELGLRRSELAGVTFGDFDLGRGQLLVTGKGGYRRYVPIVDEAFWNDLGIVELEAQAHGHPEWFLICKRRSFYHGTRYYHRSGFKSHSMHKWWYDRLEEAGFVGDRDSGTRVGLFMHRGRHTVATDILRETGNIVAAKELLGHKDIATTVHAYAQFDTSDLARVLREMHEARQK